jgi:hypothetical protein
LTTYNFTVGTAAQKALGLCDITGLDVQRRRRAGTIASGSTLNLAYLNGTYTGQDVCQGFQGVTVYMTAPSGDVIFDCTPIAPSIHSTLFPFDHDFNASWGNKACIIFGDGDLHVGPGFTFKNATAGTGYGNVAGIRKISFITGANPVGSLYLQGSVSRPITFMGCDNGVLASAIAGLGDVCIFDYTLFDACGSGDGQSHNMYLSPFDLFVMTNSTSKNCNVGHDVKTRARMNILMGNTIRDTAVPVHGASYAVDFSGGVCNLSDNDIGQEANDSNLAVMASFLTDRDGEGPHEWFALGNEWHAGEPYRGYYARINNPYLDPAYSYHNAPQLGWNDVTFCFDGNDCQYVDQALDYGGTANNALLIPTNSGITTIAGTNRRIPTTDPSASTPYANIDNTKLAQSLIGDLLTGVTADDFDAPKIAALLARSLSLQAAWVSPTGVPVTPPPPPPPEEEPPPIEDLTYPIIEAYVGAETPVSGTSHNTVLIDSPNNRLYLQSNGAISTSGFREFNIATNAQTDTATLDDLYGSGNSNEIDDPSCFTFSNQILTTSRGWFNGSVQFTLISNALAHVVDLNNVDAGGGLPSLPGAPAAPSMLAPASVGGIGFAAAPVSSVFGGDINILEAHGTTLQFAGHVATVDEQHAFSCATEAGTGILWHIGSPIIGSPTTSAFGLYKTTILASAAAYNTALWPGTPNSHITTTKIGTVAPADVDATWTHFTNITAPGYDRNDGNILVFVGTSDAVVNQHYLVKLDKDDATVVWALPVVGLPTNESGAFNSAEIDGGVMWYLINRTLYEIDTVAGTATTTTLSVGGGLTSFNSIYRHAIRSVFWQGQYASATTPPYASETGSAVPELPNHWFRLIVDAVAPVAGPMGGSGRRWLNISSPI